VCQGVEVLADGDGCARFLSGCGIHLNFLFNRLRRHGCGHRRGGRGGFFGGRLLGCCCARCHVARRSVGRVQVKLVRAGEDDVGPVMVVRHLRPALAVEHGERVGHVVAGQCQDGFVHHRDGQLRVGDRLPGRVEREYLDLGRAARLQLVCQRLDLQRERPGQRRDEQVQLPASECGPLGQLCRRGGNVRFGLRRVLGPLGRADEVHLDVDVGHERVLDGDAQRV